MPAPIIAAGAAAAGRTAARGAAAITRRAANKNAPPGTTPIRPASTNTTSSNPRTNQTQSTTATNTNAATQDNSLAYRAGRTAGKYSAIGKRRAARQTQDYTDSKQLTSEQIRRSIPRYIGRKIAKPKEKQIKKKAVRTGRAVVAGSAVLGSYIFYWPIQMVGALLFFLGFWAIYIDDSVTGMIVNLFPTELLLYGGWIIGMCVGVITYLAAVATLIASRVNLKRSVILILGIAGFILTIIPFTMFVPWLAIWIGIVIVFQK